MAEEVKKPYVPTPSVMLLGAPGTGKTHSLSTILKAGLELFIVVTEGTGIETILDAVEKQKLPLDKLHWKQLSPVAATWDSMLATAKKTAIMDFKGITDMRGTKPPASRFIGFLENMANFTCDHCGKSFGAVDSFGPERALAIDSMSGLNLMVMQHVIGDKPAAHQGEWGISMNMLESVINNCTSNLKCLFVITGHLEREQDMLTGGTKLMASTLGRSLAPKLPRYFSEIVMTHKEGGNYFWATDFHQVDLKHRSLPMGGKLAPDFKPIIEAYNKRLTTVNTVTK